MICFSQKDGTILRVGPTCENDKKREEDTTLVRQPWRGGRGCYPTSLVILSSSTSIYTVTLTYIFIL